MKILKVIHGYPPLYNAGSEVYSQMLCHGLANRHEVHVFTREENPFANDFALRIAQDKLCPEVTLHIINIPSERHRDKYQHPEVNSIFKALLHQIRPEVVHIGHLSHLSISLLKEAFYLNIPIVYTLHDYWLMCPRGQFIQRNILKDNLWALCDGQEDKKCATNCYAGYFSGATEDREIDISYWTDWIHRRMSHIREALQTVDYFIAPSQYLRNRYINNFRIPEHKIFFMDYGFDLQRLQNRNRVKEEAFTFGYIGTHIPAKGIQLLILAFGLLKGNSRLRIWGRPRAQYTEGLQAIQATLPWEVQARIEWHPEYRNEQIVKDVFNQVDCIVVPSVWVENSPLVIHEALQVGIPVITADTGGMAEYIHHEKNGLLFKHRDFKSLAEQMQILVNDPAFAKSLGEKRYLQSEDGNIPDLNAHIIAMEKIYQSLI